MQNSSVNLVNKKKKLIALTLSDSHKKKTSAGNIVVVVMVKPFSRPLFILMTLSMGTFGCERRCVNCEMQERVNDHRASGSQPSTMQHD